MSVIAVPKAAEYRQQAQAIRTIVEKIAIDEAREQLLETAEHLEELANEAECKARRRLRAAASIRRVIRQRLSRRRMVSWRDCTQGT